MSSAVYASLACPQLPRILLFLSPTLCRSAGITGVHCLIQLLCAPEGLQSGPHVQQALCPLSLSPASGGTGHTHIRTHSLNGLCLYCSLSLYYNNCQAKACNEDLVVIRGSLHMDWGLMIC